MIKRIRIEIELGRSQEYSDPVDQELADMIGIPVPTPRPEQRWRGMSRREVRQNRLRSTFTGIRMEQDATGEMVPLQICRHFENSGNVIDALLGMSPSILLD